MAGFESCLFEWYVAVAAYHVDLPRSPDDGSAMRADVLDAAILAGAAPAFDGRSRFAAFVIVGLGFDLERRFAAGGYILHAGLLAQPCGGFFGQRRDRPAVGGVMLDVQAMGFGGFLEFLVMVVPVVADVLDLMGQVVEMRHFMEHGCRDLADGPVDVLGADVDLPIRLAAGLPDFIHTAPAVGSAPAVWRYSDGRAGKLVIIEVMVEKVEHGLGLGYDFRYAQHCCGLPCFDVVTAYPFEHIFQVDKGDKNIPRKLITAAEGCFLTNATGWVQDKTVASCFIVPFWLSDINQVCYSIAHSIDPLYQPLTDGSSNEWLV